MSAAHDHLRRLRDDFEFYAPRMLKIVDKAGSLVPLQLNAAQRILHAALEAQLAKTGKIRALVLKGRQQGASTYLEGRLYWRVSMRSGVRGAILTHEQAATDNLFAMSKRYHDNVPDALRVSTSASNAKELVFDRLDSKISVATAGTKGVGRSSTVHFFHGCLSPDSLVVDGVSGALRRMGDMAIGSPVRTHTGKTAVISFISSQRKHAREILLKGMRSTPLVATDEHRFWTDRGWAELREIAVGDRIGFPVCQVSDEGVRWPFRLPDSLRPQGGGSQNIGPDDVAPTYDLGRMLGLFLAEGTIVRQSAGPRAPSAVSFAVHEREVARTVEWLEPLRNLYRSASVAPRDDSKTVTVTVYGRSFAEFVLARCGRKDEKALPVEWRQCGEPFVRGLIHGYLAGDGHSSKRPGDRRISAPSIRSAITVGMRDALAALGYGWACIVYRGPCVRNGRREQAQWTLRLCGGGVDRLVAELGWAMPERKRSGAYGSVEVSGGYAWVPVVSIGELEEREVMDFEVDHEDHSYCVLQGATHNSEAAFWPHAKSHLSGLGQAIPDLPGTEVVLETTSAGPTGEFHRMWKLAEAGKGDWIAVFIPWFVQAEYRREVPPGWAATDEEIELSRLYGLDDEQLAWRRAKIDTDFGGDAGEFAREYPNTAIEAFAVVNRDTFVDMRNVARARASKGVPMTGPLVVGVDPARMGADRTAIVWRRGRVVYKVKTYEKRTTTQITGLIANLIETDKPAKVFIDVVGLGVGIYDQLVEANYGAVVVGVGGAEAATEPDRYRNKRAECWARMRDWFAAPPVQIPDVDEIAADLICPGYSYDAHNRLLIESKESIAKDPDRRSPDIADAIALTFAEPVRAAKRTAPVMDAWVPIDELTNY